MKALRKMPSLSLTMPIAGLALLLGSAASSVAQSLTLPCSWPVESTGSGITNVAFPDTDATYWVMPVDTTRWTAMTVTGEYPQSRFFSFVTYFQTGGAVDSIVDANIAPDSGSTNPFQPGPASSTQNYTVTINGNTTDSGNHIHWGNTRFALVVYRIYVADKPLSRTAGVALPVVTLTDTEGNTYITRSCPQLETAAQEPVLNNLLEQIESALPGTTSCPSTPSQQVAVTFVANTSGGRFLPNPATKYVSARGVCPEPGKVIVIRGKAAVFPNTYNDSSIFQPAIPGDIQLRYWSMCNNDENVPFPVVACRPDHATQLDGQGFYTYVLSPAESLTTPSTAPTWVPSDATWLPWGSLTVPNALLFREMLPMPGFALAGDYFPKGVYCDKQLFIAQGWQGCFAAAGVSAP
jgi:hypothetical protein